MANSVPTTEADEKMMLEGGSLSKRTLLDRKRDYGYLTTFLATKTDDTVEDLLKDETRHKDFQDTLLRFFFSLRVENNTIKPKQSYADKLKRSTKGQILADFYGAQSDSGSGAARLMSFSLYSCVLYCGWSEDCS